MRISTITPINLMTFDGNPSQWPEFIADLKERVHSKQRFRDQMPMKRLLSVLRGNAKRSGESIARKRISYAATLKSLKQDFGNSLYVHHTKLNELFGKPQIKANDGIALRDFHQKVKCINTWLKSIGYLQTFFAYWIHSESCKMSP